MTARRAHPGRSSAAVWIVAALLLASPVGAQRNGAQRAGTERDGAQRAEAERDDVEPNGADLEWLARRPDSYVAQVRLIESGPAAVPPLLELAARGRPEPALQSAGTVRWIVSRWRDDAAARTVLIEQLGAFALAEGVPVGRRLFAADLLGDLGAEAVPSLEPLLSLPGMSDTAVRALGRIPGETARETLVAALERPAADRELVLETLGRRGESASLPLLVAAAEDGDAAAVRALALTALPEARNWLLTAAEAGSADAFEALLDVEAPPLLGQQRALLGHQLVRLLRAAPNDAARRRVLAAAHSPEQYDPDLAAALSGEELSPELERDRLTALMALAPALEPELAARAAAAALALDPDPLLTPQALWTCARLCSPAAAPRLGDLVGAEEPDIGLTAIRALARMEGEEASGEILSALGRARRDPKEDPDELAADLLVRALGGRTDPVAVSGLLELLGDSPAARRQAAVDAALATASAASDDSARRLWAATLAVEPTTTALAGLGRTGGAEEIALIEPLVTSADPSIGHDARQALVAIGRRLAAGASGSEQRRAAVVALESAFRAGAAVEGELRRLGERPGLVAQGGAIDAWWYTRLPARRCTAASPPDERLAALEETSADTTVWQPLQAPDPSSPLLLTSGETGAVEWLAVDLEPRTATRAELVVRASQPIEGWLDGRPLPPLASAPEQGDRGQRFTLPLGEGAHRLLLRVCRADQPLRLAVQLRDEAGRPLKFGLR